MHITASTVLMECKILYIYIQVRILYQYRSYGHIKQFSLMSIPPSVFAGSGIRLQKKQNLLNISTFYNSFSRMYPLCCGVEQISIPAISEKHTFHVRHRFQVFQTLADIFLCSWRRLVYRSFTTLLSLPWRDESVSEKEMYSLWSN